MVRGNAFKLKIAIEAYTPSGMKVESFSVDEAVLKLYKNGTLTTKEYTILEGTTILVEFDGSDALGVYGFQMAGTYDDEAWRWANWDVFQIVETNVNANIPEDCVILEDTYNIAAKIILSSGGGGITSAHENVYVDVIYDSQSDQYSYSENPYTECLQIWNNGVLPVLCIMYLRHGQLPSFLARVPMFPEGEPTIRGFSGTSQIEDTSYIIATCAQLAQSGYVKKVDIQPLITDLDTIRSEAAAGATAYQKPSSGIPFTDLSSVVQASLMKANTALQNSIAYIDLEVTWRNGQYEFDDNIFDTCKFQIATGKQPVVNVWTPAHGQLPASPICSVPLYPYGKTDTEDATSYVGVIATSDTGFIYLQADEGGGGFASEMDLTAFERLINKVEAWQSTPDDTHYPSEKLVKDSLDAKYIKPSGGIPSSDLASAVQTSLGKADTALQSSDIATSLSAQSTNAQAAGAKCVYDLIGDVETLLAAI